MKGDTERSPETGRDQPRDTALGSHLFVVIDAQRPRAGAMRVSLERDLTIGRGAKRALERGDVLRLPDAAASSMHARLVREGDGWVLQDLDSTNGTRIDGQRIRRATLPDGLVFQIGSTFLVFRSAVPTPARTPKVLDRAEITPGLATLLPAHQAALDGFARVAVSAVPMLLLGETGTGKEVLARTAHAASGRPGAFVAVNCGALPESLVESQLFGHARGAFSGAVREELGFVRAADRGTLFLDEIGDMPLSSQTALLRVLQEREVTPVGGTRPVKVDLRVVAATHRRIQEHAGFRSDLYARLAGFTHELPPLRDRREDLGLLVKAILDRHAPGRDVRLSSSFVRALLAHEWPYNVRELEQLLTVALLHGDSLDVPEFAAAVSAAAKAPPSAARLGDDDLRLALLDALQKHAGNVSEVARVLGRTRMQIHRWMKRWGIDPESYRR